MHNTARTANLLGATALALTDRLLASAISAAAVSASGAAALVVLAASENLSVTELGRRVGLSQSAAARMVDSLQADGLVERGPGIGRSVTVKLTRSGRVAAQGLLAARSESLIDAIEGLCEQDQHTLDDLLTKILARLYSEIGNTELMCRLCDRGVCTSNASCPVGAAERAARAEGQ